MRLLVLGFLVAQTIMAQGESAGVTLSIQPSTDKRKSVGIAPWRFIATGTPLTDAVAFAFSVDPIDLIAPEWFELARYNIRAEAADRDGDVRPALRQALIEKFSLVVQHEPRLVDIWVMRSPPEPPTDTLRRPASAVPRRRVSSTPDSVNPRITCEECTGEMLAEALKRVLDAEVVDETEQSAYYDFVVQWQRDDPNSMIRAWREQAGIELVRESRTREALVIASAHWPDRPAELDHPPAWPCEAAPAARGPLAALPPMDDYSRSYEERMAPRRELAREFPYDVVVQMRVQDAFRRYPHLSEEWDAALESYRVLEHSLLERFLRARLLMLVQPDLAEEVLSDMVRVTPEFPWAHPALVEWMEVSGRRDTARAEKHLQEFRRLCPADLEAFEYYRAVEDPQALREALGALSGILLKRSDDEAIAAYPHKWDMLLRTRTGELLEGARLLIRRDLIRLRSMNRPASAAWLATMRHGYQLVEDETNWATLERQVLRQRPSNHVAYEIARERWAAENPLPGPAATRSQIAAYRQKLFDALGEWQRSWPQLPHPVLDRWMLLRSLSGLGADEVLPIMDGYLDAVMRHPEFGYSVPPPAIEAAELYVTLGLRLDEVRGLVEFGFAQIPKLEKYQPDSSSAAVSRARGQEVLAQLAAKSTHNPR